MDLAAPCPRCNKAAIWEIDLTVTKEIAWAAPHAPRFLFLCPNCTHSFAITFEWSLDSGSAPRHLRLVSDDATVPPYPCIVLVDRCPHGCRAKLGLQLLPTDPWANEPQTLDEESVLGGYRCPTCDGEGRLKLRLIYDR